MDDILGFIAGFLIAISMMLYIIVSSWEDRNNQIQTNAIIKIEQNLYKCKEVFVND